LERNAWGILFRGACVPFGAVQLSPDTDTVPHNIDGKYQSRVYDYCSGYQYDEKTIVGFSHTHLNGTGHSDLGDILLMPVTGELKLNPGTADNRTADTGPGSLIRQKRLLRDITGFFWMITTWMFS
jgi:putative alpha-1,2-mannosidase